LPSEFDSHTVAETFDQELDQQIKVLLAGCFCKRPQNRPTAQELAQRFLDKYNEECSRDDDDYAEISKLLEEGQKMIYSARRKAHGPSAFSETGIEKLLEFETSWDEPGYPVRLAPQINFLIGAGVFWNLIPLKFVQLPATIVNRGTASPEGTRHFYQAG